MIRQSKSKTATPAFNRADGFRTKHKALFIFLVVGAFILVFAGLFKFSAYQSKLSDKDYAAIESAAEQVFKNVGVRDIDKYKYCSYEAPEKYSSVKLYCEVQMAGYITYENDQQAIAVAEQLEREIKQLGDTISHMTDFYEQPKNGMTSASVTFDPPLPGKQCHFNISSNDKAKKVSSYLPEKAEDNLIALEFYCSAESREEYFPVTYRQG